MINQCIFTYIFLLILCLLRTLIPFSLNYKESTHIFQSNISNNQQIDISYYQMINFDNEDDFINTQIDRMSVCVVGAKEKKRKNDTNVCKYPIEIIFLIASSSSKLNTIILCLSYIEKNSLDSNGIERLNLENQIIKFHGKIVNGFLATHPYTSQVDGKIYKGKFFGFIHLFQKLLDFSMSNISSTIHKLNTISIPLITSSKVKVKNVHYSDSIQSGGRSKNNNVTIQTSSYQKQLKKLKFISKRNILTTKEYFNLNNKSHSDLRSHISFGNTKNDKNYKKMRSKRYSHDDVSKKTFIGNIFSPQRNFALICNLCIVMDSEFLHEHGNGEWSQIILKLERVLDYISWIFRSTDWNEDEIPDNIGFRVEIMKGSLWMPFQHENKKIKYSEPRLGTYILKEFGKLDFSKCCLGVGFTMRPLLNKQVGVSFIASPKNLGGICDNRHPNPMDKMTSINLILISGASLNPTQNHPLQMPDILLVLLHELGHTFGASKHDNDVDSLLQFKKQCSGYNPNSTASASTTHNNDSQFRQVLFEPPPTKGRYIMWGKTLQGKKNFKPNNLLFSKCSKLEITNVLKIQRFTSCFKSDYKQFCGNGILEDNEECDCGNEINCNEILCCGSRSSKTPCKFLPTFSKFSLQCLKFQNTYKNFSSHSFNVNTMNNLKIQNVIISKDFLILLLMFVFIVC